MDTYDIKTSYLEDNLPVSNNENNTLKDEKSLFLFPA